MTEATRTKRGTIRRFLQNLILLTGSAVVALVLAEVAVRIAAPQQLILVRPDLWQPNDTVGWVRRANVTTTVNTGERTVTIRTDRDGFRVGLEGRREADTEILLLGDSFVEALQVEHEQHVAHLLEQALERDLHKPVVVRNAGVSGWDPNHYYRRGRALLDRDTFDLVIVGLFVGNDAVRTRVDSIPPRRPADRAEFRIPRNLSMREVFGAFVKPLNDALEEHSHLFQLLKHRLSILRMRTGLTAQYMAAEYYRSESESPRWRITAELARDLADAAKRRGAQTVFVLIPESFQVNEELFRSYVRGFKLDTTALDLEQPNRRLQEELARLGLTVVDALPAFRAAPDRTRLFGAVDEHFSPAGHARLAGVLAPLAGRFLREREARSRTRTPETPVSRPPRSSIARP